MKKFKQILSEVAQPIAGDEINFKKKHMIQRFYDPAGNDDAFTGNVDRTPEKFKNLADYDVENDEDEDVYESYSALKQHHGSKVRYHNEFRKDLPMGSVEREAHRKATLAHQKAFDAVGTKDEVALSSKADMATKMARRLTDIQESEQLDELSNGKLRSYAKAASDDAANSDDPKKVAKRTFGVLKASEKLKEAHSAPLHDMHGSEDDDVNNDGIVDSKDAAMMRARNLAQRKMFYHTEDIATDKTHVVNHNSKQQYKKLNAINAAKYKLEPEKISEGVEISHDRYLRAHGKKARDSGGSSLWMFTHKSMGDVDHSKDVHTAQGSFSDAKKSATQWAQKNGHKRVYVMEDVNQLDEISQEKLVSYMKKAMKDRSDSAIGMDDEDYHKMDYARKTGTEYKSPLADRFNKRTKGVDKAFSKFDAKRRVNEDVEQIDEISVDLKQRYFDKSKDAKRADGYGYSHKDADGNYKGDDHVDHKRAWKRMIRMNKVQSELHDAKNPVKANVHDLTHMKHDGDVYDHTQTSEKIKDGDVMKLHGGRAAVMVQAWPVITHGDSEILHKTSVGTHISKMDKGRYKKSFEVASKHATAPELKESEEINELSKKTLSSYIKKSAEDAMNLHDRGERLYNAASDGNNSSERSNMLYKKSTDAHRKAEKRLGGVGKAADKLSEDGAAYAIGMSKAKKIHNDEPPLRKKTIKTAHKIAKSILGEDSHVWYDIGHWQEGSQHFDNVAHLEENIQFGEDTYVGIPASNEEAIAYMDKHAPSLHEDVDQLDEISSEMKAKYLDKAVQQRYDFFTGGRNTPAQKRRKPASHYEKPEIKKALEKDAKRGEIIDKTAKELTGKPHYNKMSTSTSKAVDGNAGDWWKGKKYATEEVEQIEEAAPREWYQTHRASGLVTAQMKHPVPGDQPTYHASEADAIAHLDKKYKRVRNGVWTDKKDQLYFHKKIVRNITESVDQLDELSKDTLASYVKKASNNLGDNRFHSGKRRASVGWDEVQTLKNIRKRKSGIANAVNKLVKEDENLTEAFSAGSLKLDDGSYVTVNKQDAALLNQMFNDLNAGNKKKMEAVLMKDKHGFQEILGFAREAL